MALLKEADAAKLLGLAVATLRTWRSREKGPEWIKMGRTVRYDEEAIKRYILEGRRIPSAETAAAAAMKIRRG